MSSIIRSLMIKIGVDLNDAQKGLANASRALKAAGKDFTQAGKTLTSGLTVPILGAVAGVGALVVSAGKAADELITLSAKTGISTKALQEFQYASRFVDVEVETMTGSMVKLTKSMDAARDGTKDQEEAFRRLGIEYMNSDGSLRNAKDVWMEALDALNSISNEAERDAISLRLFGRSAAELNPLIKAGSTELKRLATEANTVGAVVSDKSVTALGKFDDSMQKLQAVLKSAGVEIAASFTPIIEKLTPIINDKIVPAMKKFVGHIKDLVDGFMKLSPNTKTWLGIIAGYAVAIGPTLTVFGKMSTMFSGLAKSIGTFVTIIKGGGSFTAALGGLIGPAGVVILVTAALAALVAVSLNLTRETREAKKAMKEFSDELATSEANYQDKISKIKQDAELSGKLADELYDLAEKESKSNEEKTRMKMLVSQLNELLPELNLTIDEQTGALSKNRQETEKLTQAKKDQLYVEAMEERMIELMREKLKAVERLRDAQEKLKDIETKNPNLASGWNYKAINEWLTYNDIVEKSQKEVDDFDRKINNLGTDHDKYAAGMIAGEKKVAEEFKTTGQITEEELDAQAKTIMEFYQELEDLTRQHYDSMGEIDKKGIDQKKLTAKQVQKNLEEQIKDFRNWRTTLKTLAAKVPEDVMTELAALGPQYSDMLTSLNKMTPKQLDKFVATWQEKTRLASDTALEEIRPLSDELWKVAGNTALMFAEGLSDEEQLAAIRSAAQQIADASKPRVDLTAEGQMAGQGFIGGLLQSIPEIKRAAQQMSTAARAGLVKYLEISSPSKVFQRLGEYVPLGFVSGIQSKLGLVQRAFDSVVAPVGGYAPSAAIGMAPVESTVSNRSTSVNMTNNIYGQADPNAAANLVVSKLRMAGVVV